MDAKDLANVRALNTSFLNWLALGRNSQCLPGDCAWRFNALSRHQRARLAQTPFLLLSLHEDDSRRWQRIFALAPQRPLWASVRHGDETATHLVTLAASFIWQLAARNAYAARVISGASLAWCEQLRDCTLVAVTERLAEEPALLTARAAHNQPLWNHLLSAAESGQQDACDAANASLLQSMLEGATSMQSLQFASAACKMPQPAMRVADDERD